MQKIKGFTPLHPVLSDSNGNIQLRRSSNRDVTGFTLIELLVVIAIIGFLATASMVAYTTVKMKGRNTKRHADTSTIQKALGLFQTRNEKFPFIQGATESGLCLIGTDAVSNLLKQDLPTMPTDPSAKAVVPIPTSPGTQSAPHCFYYTSTDGNTYTLQYYVEGEGEKIRTP